MSDISEPDQSCGQDLAADNEALIAQNNDLTEKLEALNQEVHSLRTRLHVAESVQADYQFEIDHHQQEAKDIKAANSLAVLKLKDDHAEIVHELLSKAHTLENELQEIRNKHAQERDEFIKTKRELNDMQYASPVTSLKAELQEVLEEHAANRMACVQHQDLNKMLMEEKSELLEELNRTREHHEITQEKLKICKADLVEQSEALEEVRESLAVAQSELACLKSAPSESVGRGNSLFAEVEDKRQSMLKKCSTLTKKYSEMKKDYSAKCAEISRLKMENLKLRRQWQEEAEERDNRDVWLNDNYEIRIKELVEVVRDLKQAEKAVFVNGDSNILTYAEHMVEKSKKELSELREEMERRSSERLNEAKALYTARCDVQTLKTQVMSLHAENLVLRDKLDEADISDIPSPGKTLKRLRKIWHHIDEDSGSPSAKFHLSEENHQHSSSGVILKDDSAVPSSSAGHNQTPLIATQEHSSAPTKLPFISSLVSNIPKPSHLIKLEIVENYQNENKCIDLEDKNGSTDHGMPNLSLAGSQDPMEEDESNFVLTQTKEGSPEIPISDSKEMEAVVNSEPTCESLIKTEESLESSDFSSSIKTEATLPELSSLMEEMQESTEFSPSHLNKPVSVLNADSKDNVQSVADAETEVRSKIIHKHQEATISENYVPASIKLVEDLSKSHRDLVPAKSILAKPSRSIFAPLDENSLARKVRFADKDTSASPEEAKSRASGAHLKVASPKKKPQKTYKTRFVTSKETDFQ